MEALKGLSIPHFGCEESFFSQFQACLTAHSQRADMPKAGLPSMSYLLIEIGPQEAFWLLSKNIGNRNMERVTVEKYATEMRLGKWNSGHDSPIVMGKDFVLRNGQHRLKAVVRSGKRVRFSFQYMPELESCLVRGWDDGRVRTLGDYTGNTEFAATVNCMCQFMMRGIGAVTRQLQIDVSVAVEPERTMLCEYQSPSKSHYNKPCIRAGFLLAMVAFPTYSMKIAQQLKCLVDTSPVRVGSIQALSKKLNATTTKTEKPPQRLAVTTLSYWAANPFNWQKSSLVKVDSKEYGNATKVVNSFVQDKGLDIEHFETGKRFVQG